MSGTSSNASMSSPVEAQRSQPRGRSQSWKPIEEYDSRMHVDSTEDVSQLEELHRELLMDNLRLWECINILRCNTRLVASNVLQQVYKQSDDDFFRNYPSEAYSNFELSGHGALTSTAEGGGRRHPEKYVQHLKVHNGGLSRENARLLLGLDLLNQSPDRSADEVICHCFALSDENFAKHYPTAARGSRLRATLNKMKEEARSRQRSHSLPAHLQSLAFRRSVRQDKNNGPSCSNNNELYLHRGSIRELTPTALRVDPFCTANLKVQRRGPGSRHKNTPLVETRLARGGLGDPLGGSNADSSDFPRRRHISSSSSRPTSRPNSPSKSGNRRAQAKFESGRPRGRSTDNSYQDVPYMVSHYPYNWATSNNSSIHVDPLDHADRGGGVGFLPEEDEEGGVVYRKHRLVPGNSKDFDVTGVGMKGPRISYSRSPASVSKQARFVDTGDMCRSLDLLPSLEPAGKFGAKFSPRKGTTFPFTRFDTAERGLSPADSKRMAERRSGRRLSFGSEGPEGNPSSSAGSLASLKRSGCAIPSSTPFIIRRARSPEKKCVTFSGMPIASPERERRGRSSRSPAGHHEKPRPMYYKAPVEKREHLWSGEESNEDDDLRLPRHSSLKKDRSQSRERSFARRFHERSPEQRFRERTPERRINEMSPERSFNERSPRHRSYERSLPPSFRRPLPESHRLNRSRSEDFSSSCTGHLDMNQSRNELLKLRERLREDELLSNYEVHNKKRSTFSRDNPDRHSPRKLRPLEPSNTIIVNPRNRSSDSSNRAKNRKHPTTRSFRPISARASTSTSSLRDLSPRKQKEKPKRTVSTSKIAPSADAHLDESKTHRYPTQRQRRPTSSSRERPKRSKELLQSTSPPHVDCTAPSYAETAQDENVNRHIDKYASSDYTDPATDSMIHRYPTQKQRCNTSPSEQPKRSMELLESTPSRHVYYEAPPYAETAQDENVNRHIEKYASTEYTDPATDSMTHRYLESTPSRHIYYEAPPYAETAHDENVNRHMEEHGYLELTDQGAEVPFLERLMTMEDEENNVLAELLEEKHQLDLKYARDSSCRQNLSPRSFPTSIYYPEEPVDERRYSLSNPTDGRRSYLLNPIDERRSSLSNPTDGRRYPLSDRTDGRYSSLLNPIDERRSSLSNPTDGRRSYLSNPINERRSSLSNPTDERRSSFSDPCFPHCTRVTSPPNNEPPGFMDYNNHHSLKSNAEGFTEYTHFHSPQRNAADFVEYNSHHGPERNAAGSIKDNSHHFAQTTAAGFREYHSHHRPEKNAAGFREYNSHHSPERNAAGFREYNSHHNPERNAAGFREYNSHHNPERNAAGFREYNSHHSPERNAAGFREYNSHHNPERNAAGSMEYNSHLNPERNAAGFTEYNSHHIPETNTAGSTEYSSHHSSQENASCSAIDDENTCTELMNPVDELRLRTDRLHKSRDCRQHRSRAQEAALERACKGAYDNLGTPLVCPATRSHRHSKKNQNCNSHRHPPVPGWISMLSHEVPMKREDLDLQELSESTQKKLDELTEKVEAARKSYYDAPAALLGEVAFQLERRIIHQVFHEKKSATSNKTNKTRDNRYDDNNDNNDTRHRFYGFTVLNIPEKIRAEAREPKTLKRNCAREAVLLRRFQDVITLLRDECHYFVHKHGKLCQDLINKHGLFNQPPDAATITRLGLDDFRSVRNHVIKLSDKEERQDMLVIVDCLRVLALKEEKPILSFQ